MSKLKNLAYVLFVYTLLVILWGAWVRISHSGDGCGESWPLCSGQVIPDFEEKKTWVEYAHRLMSGLYGIFILGFFIFTYKVMPKGHLLRKIAFWTLLLTITEALLGAKLVLFGYVTTNSSLARTIVMALHQINSFLLTGSLGVFVAACLHGRWSWTKENKAILLLFLSLGITGAWAALGSTLFPSESLWEGVSKDFSSDSHHVLRLRVLHPLIAMIFASSLAYYLWYKKSKFALSLFVIFSLFFGLITLLNLSPVWMKLTHLCLAHCLWFCLIAYTDSSAKTSDF